MSYTIPIGPYHPALEEPYKLELVCDGETVSRAILHVGYNFRGIEILAERRNYVQDITLMERVCGICSGVHTTTYCMAVEQLAGIVAPERAQFIRVIIAELERLHSHILWAGAAAEVMGYHTLFMSCFALREKVMDVLEAISGNRVNYAMNRIGGVNRDLTDPAMILTAVQAIEQEMSRVLIPVFTTDPTVRARCVGVGVLTTAQALAWGVVGPVARASGINRDLRRDQRYGVYQHFDFAVPVETAGDVMARLVVRALEMLESGRIIRQALEKLPAGPLAIGPVYVTPPPGEAVARIEAPRGEVLYYVASNGSDIPARVRVRTPTFANMPAIQLMVTGAGLADVPLIQASIDPCYSCTDR